MEVRDGVVELYSRYTLSYITPPGLPPLQHSQRPLRNNYPHHLARSHLQFGSYCRICTDLQELLETVSTFISLVDISLY
jgi:hypothetical protein